MERPSKDQLLTTWAYAGEFIAAALLSMALFLLIGPPVVSGWVFARKQDLMVLTITAAGVSGVIFAAFFAVLSSEFGKKLRLKNVATLYATAFAFPLLVFLGASASMGAVSKGTDTILLKIATFMLVYSLLNCYTMVKNVIGLVKLWQNVDRARQFGK